MAVTSGSGDGGVAEIRRFLNDAFRSNLIDEAAYRGLIVELQRRIDERAALRPEPVAAWAASGPPGPPAHAVADRRSGEASAPISPPPRAHPSTTQPVWWKELERPVPPVRWEAWILALRELVEPELALHGLAYLGVLLTFIGAFGFVVFAYGELDRSVRPVAEAIIPLVCFLTAWFLRVQRAPHVAAGLELLGGLLLPLVAYASLVDGAAAPPDLAGTPLIAALSLVSLALCGSYAAWTASHPASPLRFLVAPMAWQVVWALGLAFADGPVVGVAIRTPDLWQMSAYVLAVVASIALVNAFPTRRLAGPTRIASTVGLAVGYALMLATGFADGWEVAPVALTGAAVVVGIDLLAAGLPERVAGAARLAQAAVVAITVAALAPDLELGWAGVAATIGAIALLERWARVGSTAFERAIAVVELAGGLAMAMTEPWAAVVAFGLASLWAATSRQRRFVLTRSRRRERRSAGTPPKRTAPSRSTRPGTKTGARSARTRGRASCRRRSGSRRRSWQRRARRSPGWMPPRRCCPSGSSADCGRSSGRRRRWSSRRRC